MSDRFKSVLLFGAPGTGKGTQGKLLGSIPGFYHLATGDIFRSLDKTSELGKVFVHYSSRGDLVPDDLTIKVWKQHVDGLITAGEYRPGEQLLCLDGMPRSVGQAETIGEYIDVLRIVHLVADNVDAMVQRMQRRAVKENRHDDAKEEVIRNRFEVYRTETQPVLDYFGPHLVSNVDAIGSPAAVLCQVLQIVAPIQEMDFGNILEK